MEERDAIRRMLRQHPAFARKLLELAERRIIRSAEELLPGDIPVIVGGDTAEFITGSRQYHCSRCGSFIWLAPSTQEFMAKLTCAPILACLRCALSIRAKHKEQQ